MPVSLKPFHMRDFLGVVKSDSPSTYAGLILQEATMRCWWSWILLAQGLDDWQIVPHLCENQILR